jgi:RNA polymerase sigma factor (sigma-70 family)
MNQEITDILDLIRGCVDGDPHARRRFQTEYGEVIYSFPMKKFARPQAEAADFYVYVFDNDRIFSRIRHFKEQTYDQFRIFLWGLVLRHLFFEWQRTLGKEVDEISLHTPLGGSEEKGQRTLEDILSAPIPVEPGSREVLQKDIALDVWHSLTSEERLDVKLLHLLEYDLEPEDVGLLAKVAGRSIRETLVLLAEVQEALRHKDEKFSQLQDALDSVWGWIRLRQKELQETNEKIRSCMAVGRNYEQFLSQKEELERSLKKRYEQRDQIIKKYQTSTLTTPYKDIARLLNTTVGTVCSRMSRLRARLVQKLTEEKAEKE